MTPSSSTDALTGRRITICSINFAPEETGIAPYSTGIAEHLSARGAAVRVIAGFPHYPHWRVFDGYKGFRRKEFHGRIEVIRRRQFTPRRHNGLSRAAYEFSWLVSGLTYSAPATDLVMAVTPSLAGVAIAQRIARHQRVPLGVIIQDLTGPAAAQSGITGAGPIQRTASAVEVSLLGRADAAAIVSPAFRQYLIDRGIAAERIFEIRNWSKTVLPVIAKPEARSRMRLPQDKVIALHCGNMGAKQGLESVLDAARAAARSQPRLHFVLIGDGNQRPHLQTLAADLPNVTIRPPAPSPDFPYALAAADVLLVNERPSVIDMSLPSKLTSYFMAERPVLAAVRPDGATAAEVGRSGGGTVVPPDNATALVDGITRLTSDTRLASQLAKQGRAYALRELSASAALRATDSFVDHLLALGGTARRFPERTSRRQGIVREREQPC